MSKNVRVLPSEKHDRRDTATLLLAAAEESEDFGQDVVQVSSYGGFTVPEEIAKAAGLDYEEEGVAQGHVYSEKEVEEAADTPVETPEGVEETEADEQPTAKKAAAKKTTAKKAAAKKTGGR